MSKHQKIIDLLRSKKAPPGIKWTELKSLLEHFGYVMLKPKGGGSSRKFYHKQKDILFICHQPHPSPCVDKGCIADVSEHLRENEFI
ncbi:type II toxin-antitoxin system HicA family toxin [Desulfobulbus oligotrophicus]|uniref:Type II toxin-antitoxin system HicA family toxin n=1 Tax=Desulfobulbus oligotrophicus TaxID=1909699 RepID=A0A7T5VEC0_9BACT|nr:type II toxin-antitoxin system HicA family toxin [Desulfobulbus oligotrophicus]